MQFQELPKAIREYKGAKYTLKNISPILDTADGVCFSAVLYKNNKPFADVYDDGWGGPLSYNFHVDVNLSFDEQEDMACEVVYWLLDQTERIKYIKKHEKNAIVFGADTTFCCLPIKRGNKTIPIKELQTYPQGIDFLTKTIKKYTKDGYKVLNTNIDISLIPS